MSFTVAFMSQKEIIRPALLIVDDDNLILDTLSCVLSADHEVVTASDRPSAIALVRTRSNRPDLALIDLGLPPHEHRPDEGLTLIEELVAHDPYIKIIALSGQNEETNARHARTIGALDFIPKPARPDVLRAALAKALQLRREEVLQTLSQPALLRLRGTSPILCDTRTLIQQYASSPFPLLIEGESGTGKELAAQALHELSTSSAGGPFVALNCAAISTGLIESILFGHVRGSFTGAIASTSGYFEEAGGGTLFLDEIGELPIELQPKLLRVLETGEYQRVGETTSRRTRARIVAATNRNLRLEAQQGRFRADLYHRLSVLRISMPPLRSMGGDKIQLLEYFARVYTEQTSSAIFQLSDEAKQLCLEYEFPGNVRELRNIVVRLLTRYAGMRVTGTQFANELDREEKTPHSQTLLSQPKVSKPAPATEKEELQSADNFSLDAILRATERRYIMAALELSKGNISRAARYLGMNRTTLYSRIENLSRSAPRATLYDSTTPESKDYF